MGAKTPRSSRDSHKRRSNGILYRPASPLEVCLLLLDVVILEVEARLKILVSKEDSLVLAKP